MRVYAPGWILASQVLKLYPPLQTSWFFPRQIIPPPPPKVGFSAPKNDSLHGCAATLTIEKISDTRKNSSSFSAVFLEILSRRSRFSRATCAQKSGNFQAPKMRVFCFSGENFGTILSRHSLFRDQQEVLLDSTNSTMPDRLRLSTRTDGEEFLVFAHFFRAKKRLFERYFGALTGSS